MIDYVKGFVVKFANDWVTNLAAMLAYNLLMSLFPIILALLSIVGFVVHDHRQQEDLINQVLVIFPADARTTINLNQMLSTVHHNAGFLFALSLVAFLWIGGNLFGTMENAFGVIYRIKGRDLFRQKIMCLGMIFIFAVLVPAMIVASSLLEFASGPHDPLWRIVPPEVQHLGSIVGLLGPITGFVAAFVLFFTIYLIVPNVVIDPHLAWRGALVAAALLELANLIFPYYVDRFINTKEYGVTLAFAIVLMIWFWFFGIILLLGAEINAYVLGHRALPEDLAGSLHKLEAGDRRAAELPFHRAHRLQASGRMRPTLLRLARQALPADRARPAWPAHQRGGRDETRRGGSHGGSHRT
jgi:YihY family inner membrane protein